jgi:hypothetical protein
MVSVCNGESAAVKRYLSLRGASLLAVLAWTAHAHWALAVLLGAPTWLAWCLPVALDAYVLASLRLWEVAPKWRQSDLAWALMLDGMAVAGSHAAGQLAPSSPVKAALAAALGVVLVLVLWRVHALDVTVRRATASRQRQVVPAGDATVASPPRHGGLALAHEPSPDVASWVAAQRAAGATRAEATRAGAALYGCSVRTMQRRWDQAS